MEGLEVGAFVLKVGAFFKYAVRLQLAGEFLFELLIFGKLVGGGFASDKFYWIVAGGVVPGGSGRRGLR